MAIKYGIHISTLSAINNGKTYYHSTVVYPLRNSKNCKKIISGLNSGNSYLTKEVLDNIYNDLINKQDVSMKKIAEIYGVSSSII